MSQPLSSPERVLRAIARRGDIDRIPFIFRAEAPLMRRLRQELGAESDLAVLRHFGADSMQVGVVFRPEAKQPADANGVSTDIFGNRFQTIKDGDLESYHVIGPALAGASSVDDLRKVRWPGAEILDLDASVAKAREARASGLCVYGGVWASIFTGARSLLGEEDFLMLTVDNPELVSAVVGRLAKSYMEINAAYLKACRGLIDVYYFGSDLGTQRSLFMGPRMCRQFIFPSLGRIAKQAKSFGLPVMYHTCGAVSGLVDDLIAAGVDCLDPIQVSATGMEPANLAAKYKGQIAFHGGISTQTTLPFGTPDEVREACLRTIQTLGPTALIAGPDQEMIGQIPLANLEAMSAAIRGYRL